MNQKIEELKVEFEAQLDAYVSNLPEDNLHTTQLKYILVSLGVERALDQWVWYCFRPTHTIKSVE